MADVHRPLGERLQHDEARVCYELRRYGVAITVDEYKVIRALTRLAGVIIGGIALVYFEADPITALTLITVMVLGPDFAEVWLTRE